MLRKEFVDEAAHGRFGGVRYELLILPLIAEGRSAADGVPHLCADRNGLLHAVCDFLALPLAHGGKEREEEAPRWRAGVYGFLQGDEVCPCRAELVREVQKLFGVSRQARELGENEPADMTRADSGKHPFCFGMLHDGFAGDAFKVEDLAHVPPLGLGIKASALLMDGGTFALGLFFGGDTKPDTD